MRGDAGSESTARRRSYARVSKADGSQVLELAAYALTGALRADAKKAQATRNAKVEWLISARSGTEEVGMDRNS